MTAPAPSVPPSLHRFPRFGNASWRLVAGLVLVAAASGVRSADGDASAWPEWLKARGDVRLRGDFVRDESGSDDDRALLRLRGALDFVLNDRLTATFGAATYGGRPTSRDVSLDEELARAAAIHLASLAWRPEAAPDLALYAGRMAKPFLCVQDLVWDLDWNPDGLAARHKWSTGPDEWTFHAGGFAPDAADRDTDDVRLYTAQVAGSISRSEQLRVLGGVGGYIFDGLRGSQPIFDDPAGNRIREVDGGGVLADDFHEVEGFASVTWDPYFPIRFIGQVVVNTATGDEKTGWLGGVVIGRAQAIHSVEFGWNWRELDREAVVGALTDDEFAGGGAGTAGHRFFVRYQFARDWQVGAAWLNGRRSGDDGTTEYDRIFVDLSGRW